MSESPRDPEVDALRARVQELEEAVLYLSNTLVQQGLIGEVEGRAARRMYDHSREARRLRAGDAPDLA